MHYPLISSFKAYKKRKKL